jgi:hypothetical protein
MEVEIDQALERLLIGQRGRVETMEEALHLRGVYQK